MAAGTGVGVLIVLVKFDVPILIAGLVAAAVTTRLAAVIFGWTFPEQRAVGIRRSSAATIASTRNTRRSTQ